MADNPNTPKDDRFPPGALTKVDLAHPEGPTKAPAKGTTELGKTGSEDLRGEAHAPPSEESPTTPGGDPVAEESQHTNPGLPENNRQERQSKGI